MHMPPLNHRFIQQSTSAWLISGEIKPNMRNMNEQVGKTIGDRLKTLEKNQAWLAEQVGVSINAVSKWTRTGKVSRQNLPAIAKALGISMEELLFGGDARLSQAIEQQATRLERLDPMEARVIELFRECPQPVRDVVLSQLELHAMAARAPHPALPSPNFRNKA